MKPLSLTAETQAVFARIRTYDLALRVFGMSQSQAWRLVEARVENRINAAGVAVRERNQHRSYMWEVLKAFRTETGEPLVRALGLAIGKWANLGLAPALLQELLCVCFLRFEQVGYAMPATQAKPSERKRGPKPRRLPRRCYEKALNKGRVSRRRSGKLEEQIAVHREGPAHAAVIADRLRPVLAERDTPGDRFVGYFAQKPGRYVRNCSGETLRMAASDLIALYEAKHLDRDALLAIAAILFGVNVGS